jgi:hypothetical protein
LQQESAESLKRAEFALKGLAAVRLDRVVRTRCLSEKSVLQEARVPQLNATLPAASIRGCFSIFRIASVWPIQGWAERDHTCTFGTS